MVTGGWVTSQANPEASVPPMPWVYSATMNLLASSHCSGAYLADLGPDPRDATLAMKAFQLSNWYRGNYKNIHDPQKILAYSCPPRVEQRQQPILHVTGESGVGKQYCAGGWAHIFRTLLPILQASLVTPSEDMMRLSGTPLESRAQR
jgi:hypothetical protein